MSKNSFAFKILLISDIYSFKTCYKNDLSVGIAAIVATCDHRHRYRHLQYLRNYSDKGKKNDISVKGPYERLIKHSATQLTNFIYPMITHVEVYQYYVYQLFSSIISECNLIESKLDYVSWFETKNLRMLTFLTFRCFVGNGDGVVICMRSISRHCFVVARKWRVRSCRLKMRNIKTRKRRMQLLKRYFQPFHFL